MKAIDVHAHLNTKEMMEVSLGKYNEAMQKYYKFDLKTNTPEEMAREFIQADVKGILMGWDAESGSGLPKLSNDSLAQIVKGFPDAFIGGFAGVDPWKGEMAIKETERAVKELGLMGLKFQPALQAFYPNDRHFYPLWEKCAELKIPVQFHTGTTGIGAGLPGGMGIKLEYCKPLLLDAVAADFPELTIIACHPSWPWQDEMIAVLIHKANVYNELSGWSPKYFSDALKKEIGGRLQDKFMFGSDYPALTHDRLFKDWDSLGLKPEVLEKVFYKNAQRILGLQ
ncbi:MAG: amidohydrolase [Deltaproteobacteria bacterium]|nr:amidohydrolase [Deltaproteobacteria bacterium]